MKKDFTASGYEYVFEVVKGNEIIFYLKNGVKLNGEGRNILLDEAGLFELGHTETVSAIENPIGVFLKVRKLLIEYILDGSVAYFCFKGMADRIKIYQKFADSLEQFGYKYTLHHGLFTFYRQAQTPL